MIARVSLALTAALWILSASAQTTSASIEGRIINLKTGAPLRDATVVLSGPYAKRVLAPDDPPLPSPVRVSSGEQGRFAFHGLAAGNYLISAGHAGFRGGGYGEPRVARELLPVGGGQQVKDVVIKLAPLGVIAGKVTDEAGVPLQNARITTYRYVNGVWLRTAQAGEPTPFGYTNDLGDYRAVLPPGPYVVSAAYPFALARLEPDLTPGLGHPTTYYPNAPGPENAQPLTVVSGETVKADFKLRKAPAYRISGFLAGPDGRRVWGQACVGILPKDSVPSDFLLLGSITSGFQDGAFTIVAVPAGSYLLTAAALCGSEAPVSGVQALEVSGNLDDLKLHVTPAQQVPGTLKLEGDANLAGASVYLLPIERFPGRVPNLTISNSSSLIFEGALSLHYVPEVRRLPINCYVKSARYGGQEVAATGFQPVAGASLELTLSTLGAAQLTGSVADQAGRPVRYPLVTVMPSDGGPVASAKSVMGDADGKFVFQALRPGEYRAAAFEEVFDAARLAGDPRISKLYRERGKVVTVQPGTPPAVALTLIGADEVDVARSKP
ncbi:MAG: carboxypeptidase-like regulatory domain-containing protein [Bryobacteraceae bacterium]